MTIKFNSVYFYIAFTLLLAEIFIGLCVHDEWMRPYGGDFLVVIILYSLIRSFLSSGYRLVAIGVLQFAYVTETMQYLQVVELLHLQHNQLASTIIGTQFSWIDMLMYTLGIGLVWLVEHRSNSI